MVDPDANGMKDGLWDRMNDNACVSMHVMCVRTCMCLVCVCVYVCVLSVCLVCVCLVCVEGGGA